MKAFIGGGKSDAFPGGKKDTHWILEVQEDFVESGPVFAALLWEMLAPTFHHYLDLSMKAYAIDYGRFS